MKLNEVRPYLETSGELEEQFFSIQDTGMIFDILRNKMYSNPILAITREISCNARDAHREVGTPEVPIRIHLPNSLEPEYRIKDFGPGISPDRMSNIFIKYTASTKRDDNVQTGGFGLGAKTPFSYSDSFSIVTVHNGTRYVYNCLIDSTKVGKLMLGHEEPTAEPNGTEIIIPVRPKNFTEFTTWTEQACRHWKVRPVITGAKLEWTDAPKILEGKNWAITAVGSDYYNRSAKMIIDGIEYPLDLDVLRKYADGKLIDATRGNFLMYFDVGELSLSASREQIYLDEKTQVIIRNRLTDIQNDIKQNVSDKINAFPDYWTANVYYRKELSGVFNSLSFLGQLAWQGTPLNDNYVDISCSVFTFIKGKYSRKHGTDPNKLSRGIASNISFDAGSELYVNDLPIREPTPRHVKKAFEDNPLLKSIQVVCPSDKITIADLNKSIHLDKMLPKLLSSITKASARTYTPAANRLLVFKFDVIAHAFRQVSYASIEEDPKNKVLCFLNKDVYPVVRNVLLDSKKILDNQSIKTLATKFPNTSIYGVDVDAPADRVREDFNDFTRIETFIKEKVLDNTTINYLEIKYAIDHHHNLDDKSLRAADKIIGLVTNPDSLYTKRLKLHSKLREMARGDLGLLSIYEQINGAIDDAALAQFKNSHPEYDVTKLETEYDERYPLMDHISAYNFSEIIPFVAQYINLIDKEHGEHNV